jgi:hypothetical protein
MIALAAVLYARTRGAYKSANRYRDTTGRMKQSGVTQVFFSRAQYATTSDKSVSNVLVYLSTTRIRLRYIGLWMAQASELHRLDETIRHLLDRGCEVSFCILDPRMSATKLNAVSDALGSNPAEVRARIKTSADKLLALQAALPETLKSRFSISSHTVPLTGSLIEFDWDTEYHRCWLDMKLRSRGRAESITLEVLQGQDSLIQRVASSFAEISSSSKPLV